VDLQPSTSREISPERVAGSGGSRDPLDVVTELDLRALDHPCGVFRGTASDGVLRVNQHFLDITGLRANAARGWDWLVAVQSEDRDRLRRAIDAACTSGAGSAFPIRMQVRLGVIQTLRVSVTATPGTGDDWVFIGAVEVEAVPTPEPVPVVDPVAVDATDPYEILVTALPIAMAYAASDGVIEFANDAWTARTGEGIDGSVYRALAVDTDDATDTAAAALLGDAAWDGPFEVAGRPMLLSVVPLADRLGGGHIVTLVDLPDTDLETEAEPAAVVLADELATPPAVGLIETFIALLDATPDYGALMEPGGALIHMNPSARALLGLGADERVEGRGLREFAEYRDATHESFDDIVLDALADSGVMMSHGEVVDANGVVRPVSVMLFALNGSDDEPEALVCLVRDGTDLQHAEQQLREREQWYRTMLAHSFDVVTVLDADLVVTYASPSSRELHGVDPEALLGRRHPDLVHADDVAGVVEAIAHARTSGEPVSVRHRAVCSDGTLRVLETRIEDLLDEPVIQGIVLNTRDITETDCEVKARDRSEAAFRTLVRSAPAAIYAVDVDGNLQLWNPGCEELFGWTADEVVGSPPPFLSDAQRTDGTCRASGLLNGDELVAEAEFQRRDGTPVTARLAVAPIVTGDGQVTSVVTVAIDVTDRVRAIEQLERRADVDRLIASLARTLVDATPVTIEARSTRVLQELATSFGANAAALCIRAVHEPDLVWPTDTVFAMCGSVDLPNAGAFVVPDDASPMAVGGWVVAGDSVPLGVIVLRWDALPAVTSDDLEPLDVIGAALVAAKDRVDAENAVHASDLRFRTLAEHSTDLVMVVGADLQPQYISPAASRFLGVSEADRFDPASSLIHPDDGPAVREQMTAIAVAPVGTQSDPIVARFLRDDGVYRWVELVVTNLLAEPVVGGIVINARDINHRREVEEQLRASESRFRGLVQNLAEGVTVLAADGSVKYSSPSAARMMGFEQGHGDGMLGLDFIVEEDRERASDVVARAFSEPGIQGPIALRVHAADGQIRVVEAMGHNRLDDPEVEGVVVTTRDITDTVAAEDSARRSDARLSALVENLSDVVTIVDAEGRLSYTSPAARALFGFEEGDESWTDPMARLHPDDRNEAVAQLERHVAGESQEPVRFRLRAADGTWRSVEAIARDMTGDPDVAGIVVTTRDVSARTRAENLVADQARLLTLVARGAPLSSTLSALCEVLERNVDEVICGFLLVDHERQLLKLGAGPRIPMDLAEACQNIPIGGTDDVFGSTAARGATAVILDIDGDSRADNLRDVAHRCGVAGIWSTPIFDSMAQRVIGTLAMFFDSPREPSAAEREVVQMFSQTAAIAIERQTAEDLLAHRANHDSLTGLPNRVLFLEFLSRALARSSRDRSALGVLFLDLDRFKHINDGLGHDAGDEVLRELARRLEGAMRPMDIVARFGGDEFTVLCEGLDAARAEQHVSEVARRLLDVVEQPLTIDGEDRRLSASVGIAMAVPSSTPDGMLRDADAAMYEAKQRGKARSEIFNDDMRSSMTARLDLESRLERAIERDEFRLFLQPIIDLATGRCVGAEALLRWQDPELGLVTPDAFIGLAEDTGLIIPIGEWALADACRTVARWEEVGLLSPEFTMAVNLSARQVAQADLAEKVRAVIEQSGPMASRICLEITESVLMEESSVEAMQALRDLGVRLSIDDFGTGYSSLGYLKRFPVDSVKVDRSFVDGLGTDGEDSAIVAAVVSLGHALGLSVVAEGVETSGQLRELLALGCDRAQGYWFSGPRDPTEFAGLLNQQPWIDGRSSWGSK
jgi:PAS domain S-box/diguanylate cyclase (GGDEF) domain